MINSAVVKGQDGSRAERQEGLWGKGTLISLHSM